ncbi:hypothetical protein LCL96_13835 [Rossellomorea aquimaris]|uniref:hypothetical protein n=1 Tax=Rossellomorea aquimaris TaxID=189382 RepID=UPI001CD58C6E|nr:hypothetical protein [Rossellomorea aquimaris]MCA1060013.1 hypothetical protein [Rossellomorea aquimaris]
MVSWAFLYLGSGGNLIYQRNVGYISENPHLSASHPFTLQFLKKRMPHHEAFSQSIKV